MGKINQRTTVNGKLKVVLNVFLSFFFSSLFFFYFVCTCFFFFFQFSCSIVSTLFVLTFYVTLFSMLHVLYIHIHIHIYIYIYIPGFIKMGSKDAAVDHSPASILPRRIGQFGTDSVFCRSKTLKSVI